MQGTDFNIRHLRAFHIVQENQGITSASKVLHMSQPALTQAIAKLEATLATPLFSRSNKGMLATEAGQVFGARVARALGFLTQGAQSAAQQQKLSASPGFAHLLSTTQLRALVAVATQGNYSLAARALGLSQPSVFRAARELEQLSGLILFERTRTGIALTPSAATLTRAARLAFAELDQGLEELQALSGRDSGSITIGSLPLARAELLPRAIGSLAKALPATRVDVIDGPYDDLLHALRDGEIDLLIGALREPPPAEDVMQERLFDDRLGVYCAPTHPLAQHPGLAASDLVKWPWIVPRRGTPTRACFDRFFEQHGMTPPDRLVESSSMILARGLLAGGERLTMLSQNQVGEELRSGHFHQLPVLLDDLPRPIGLTYRRSWVPTPTQALARDLLRQSAQSLPAA